MKIHSIAFTPSFGYNKELNEKVNKKLEKAKGNKELAQTVLAMNKFAMETEDKLRAAEKTKNKALIEKYSELLFPAKISVTNMLEHRFPQLNYRKTEINSYLTEVKNKKLQGKEYWMNELIDDLKQIDALEDTVAALSNDTTEDITQMPGIRIIRINAEDIKETLEPNNVNEVKKEEKPKPTKTHAGAKYVEAFVPTVFSPKGFDSLGGMQEIKENLYDRVITPLKDPELAKLDEVEYGKRAPRGELFYGPPGCGKSSVIEALSQEANLPLYKLKISKSGSKYINESSTNIQKAYEYLKEVAQTNGTPVLFAIDEMETIVPSRSQDGNHSEDNKMVGTLLQIIEEARGHNVIVLGATNYYDMLDDAIKSRLDDKIYIGLPDDDTRRSVLKILLNRITKGQPLAENPNELEKVVKLTKGFSNRDLTILTDKAAMIARADNRRPIIADDFIVPVNKNQNMKVKEDLYKDKTTKPSIGFNLNRNI